MINAPAPAKLSTLSCDDSKVSRPDVCKTKKNGKFSTKDMASPIDF